VAVAYAKSFICYAGGRFIKPNVRSGTALSHSLNCPGNFILSGC